MFDDRNQQEVDDNEMIVDETEPSGHFELVTQTTMQGARVDDVIEEELQTEGTEDASNAVIAKITYNNRSKRQRSKSTKKKGKTAAASTHSSPPRK